MPGELSFRVLPQKARASTHKQTGRKSRYRLGLSVTWRCCNSNGRYHRRRGGRCSHRHHPACLRKRATQDTLPSPRNPHSHCADGQSVTGCRERFGAPGEPFRYIGSGLCIRAVEDGRHRDDTRNRRARPGKACRLRSANRAIATYRLPKAGARWCFHTALQVRQSPLFLVR
jgi:hypothetical protein